MLNFLKITILLLSTTYVVKAQKNKDLKGNDNPTYFLNCSCLIDNAKDISTWVYFEPIAIKKNKSGNFVLNDYDRKNRYILTKRDENINGIADIFEQEHGFKKIAPGKRVRDIKCDVFSELSTAKLRFNESIKSSSPNANTSVTIIAWDPPFKYTGVAPQKQKPIINRVNAEK